MDFEWDPEKNRRNQAKHRIAFDDAIRVFDGGAECLEIFDEAHSTFEERFITIGPVDGRLALVVWTERDSGAVRVISARWATPRERRLFQRRMERIS